MKLLGKDLQMCEFNNYFQSIAWLYLPVNRKDRIKFPRLLVKDENIMSWNHEPSFLTTVKSLI